MRFGPLAILSAALALVTGCGLRADQQYYDAMPALDGLTLEVTGAPSEAASTVTKVGPLAASSSAATAAPEYLQDARDGVRSVNEAVHAAYDQVHSMIQNGEGKPGPVANSREYGPMDQGNVTYRLIVKKFAPAAFGFRLAGKPLGADDSAYLPLMTGAIQKDAEAHKGRGILGINLNNMKLTDSSFPGQGLLMVGYSHRDEGKALAFRAQEFSSDLTQADPITAAFVGWRRASDNGTAIRLAVKADLQGVENNTAAKELVRIRARWIPTVGGRAAAMAVGGDIPAGTAYVGRACWDKDELEVFKVLSKCVLDPVTGTPSCTVIAHTGAVTACTLADDVTEPSGDVGDTTQETGSPVTDGADAPADLPTGDTGFGI